MSRWPIYTDPVRRTDALKRALHDLKDAQEAVRMAGAPYTLLKIKAARRSLEGAIRHAQGREYRQDHTRTTTKVTRPRRIADGYAEAANPANQGWNG